MVQLIPTNPINSINSINPTKSHLFFLIILWLLLALIATPSIKAGTFRDDFEDGKLDGWRQDFPGEKKPTLWKVVKGELECTRRDSISTSLVTGDIFWKDYTMEYDVKLLEDFGPGDVDMLVRYVDFGNQVLFGIGDFFGASEVFVQSPVHPEGIRKTFEPLKLNEWHHLKVEVKGDNFTLWVNKEKVLDYTDTTRNTGAIGLGLANYTARFDNVTIIGPDVPNATPRTWKALPVQSRGKLTTTWGEIKKDR
jgi:hypothetical protein